MLWLFIVVLLIALSFGLVLFFGAPYLPTLSSGVDSAMKLADIKVGERFLELGCGDGKVLLAAAEQGATVIGYELNPFLVLLARWRTRHVRKQVSVVWGNMWNKSWPPTDVIFVFLLPKYMKKLDTKIVQYTHKPVRLISFAFEVPGRSSTKHEAGVFLYDYR